MVGTSVFFSLYGKKAWSVFFAEMISGFTRSNHVYVYFVEVGFWNPQLSSLFAVVTMRPVTNGVHRVASVRLYFPEHTLA